MLTLLVIVALGQTEVATPPPLDAPVQAQQPLTPPPPPPVTLAPETETEVEPPKLNTMGRKAGFFDAPRVGPGVLVGRIGMGLVGAAVGGGIGLGIGGLGFLISSLSGTATAFIISLPFAAIALGLGTALGAALFGADYGKNLADAVVVGFLCSLVSVTLIALSVYVVPGLFFGALIVGLVFPAVATPLLVQVFKKGDAPQPTVALARF